MGTRFKAPEGALRSNLGLLAGCYNRLERAMLSILEDKERAPKYCITLWWGFDGLREGEDGVWVWISRRDMNANIAPISTGALRTPILWANNVPYVAQSPCQNLETALLLSSRGQVQNIFPGLKITLF